MCFEGCKMSFRRCKPIIGLDGCFLKGYYGGQILAAVGRDPNEQMLPIAVTVVEGENKDSWSWFLDFLVSDLGGRGACENYTFMSSDQQKGLLPAMEELLPGVQQRFGVRHLYSNFRKKHLGKIYKELMWKAAKATYPQEWERLMLEHKSKNVEAYKDLMKIPPRYWSISRFPFTSKCDVLVNNISETFNSVILGPRGKPIVTMLEEIRNYLMERWATNRRKIQNYEGDVLQRIKMRLEKEKVLSRFWLCRCAGDDIYDVRKVDNSGEKFIVNLKMRECSCRKWMLTGIPCCHVVTVCLEKHQDPEELIPFYYRKATYEAGYHPIIYPTNGENLWERTTRPKRARNKDGDEKQTQSENVSRKGWVGKCSKCKQVGHNSRSCQNAPQATPTQTTTQSQNAPTQTTTQPQNAPQATRVNKTLGVAKMIKSTGAAATVQRSFRPKLPT